MTEISDLPNELLLILFSFLTLKSLISAQGVSTKWRLLVPLSDISPTRRSLLNLYLEIVSSPFFAQTRPWTLTYLRPFDRQAYLDTLLKQHGYLPEAFRLWILEWPARAVVGCAWPGLPYDECPQDLADGAERLEGWNCLGYIPPQVSVMVFVDEDLDDFSERKLLPGVLVWSWKNGRTWLVLDTMERLRDKVFILTESSATIWSAEGDDCDYVCSDWIEWQRYLWKNVEQQAKNGNGGKIKWAAIPPKHDHRLKSRRGRIPADAWSRRNEPGYLRY